MCEFYKNGSCNLRGKDGLCNKYKAREDGLSLRCTGSWSKEKIGLFKYYAEMFVTGMKNKWEKRYYIDLFAGPGKCIIREDLGEIDSSCLEIINLKDKFTKYFLVDKSLSCIKDLKKRVGDDKSAVFLNEDSNLEIKKIIQTIPENSLSLAIIDPDSLQFHFDNYTELSKCRVDLIVTYPIGPIERAISSVYKQRLKSDILDKFQVGAVLVSTQVVAETQDTDLAQEFFAKIEESGVRLVRVEAGDRFWIDEDIYFDILWPSKDVPSGLSDNEKSLVLKLVYKDDSFLLTGDMEKFAEYSLATNNIDLGADVLKVGHHGSNSSSAKYFLDKVQAKIAVIQVGKNSYGHPHDVVLERLQNVGMQILRNDLNGIISMYSYGNSF